MTNNYTILFVIELLHEYFLDGKCQGLEIVPTADCAALSKQLNIQYRFTGDKLVAFIRENGNNEPFMNGSGGNAFRKSHSQRKFRFYIRATNPFLLNYSNLNIALGTPAKFYLSNLAANDAEGHLYLSTRVPDFVAGQTYLPGDMATEAATGHVFECIRKTASKKSKLTDEQSWAPKGLVQGQKRVEEVQLRKTYSAGDLITKPGKPDIFEAVRRNTLEAIKDLDDGAVWINRGPGQLQYLSAADLVETCGDVYNFNLDKTSKSLSINVFGFNYNSLNPDFDVPVRAIEERSYPTGTKQIRIVLAGLEPGRYKVRVNTEERNIYFDPQLANQVIGVAEIFNHLDGNHPYSLLTKDEKFRHPAYQVQIANRRVLWKYVRKDGKAKAITDTGDTGHVFNLSGEAFVSVAPIPLTEGALKTLKLDFHSRDFSMHPLPNPPVQHLGKYSQDDYDYLCTTLLLNY